MNEVREKIFAAADALVANGKKPTLAAVLSAIGRGSSTTVNKYMQEWRAERQPSAPVAPENAAPPVIADKGARFVNELWLMAQEVSNEGLAADRAELEAERAEIHGQLQETSEYADTKAEQVELLTGTVNDLSAKLEKESHEHASTHQLLETALRENVRLESQFGAAIDRQQELKAEVAGLVERCKQADAAREKADKQATTAGEALADMRGRYEMIVARAAADLEALKSRDADRQAAEDRAKAAEVKAAELSGELTALRAQLEQQAKLFAQLTAAAEKPTKKKAEGPAKEGTE